MRMPHGDCGSWPDDEPIRFWVDVELPDEPRITALLNNDRNDNGAQEPDVWTHNL